MCDSNFKECTKFCCKLNRRYTANALNIQCKSLTWLEVAMEAGQHLLNLSDELSLVLQSLAEEGQARVQLA